ncbi:macoilin-1 [Synchiropus picturatus]
MNRERMKRRHADNSKLRRPSKRNRLSEGVYSSTFLYLKFLAVWMMVLLADFLLEFRFEYLWPFWLFIWSVYDSFRYQGLAFSVFFVCVAFTSDISCLLFIPVQWLFFAASTYVWVQYVWHTERGVCLPTLSLWILFVYTEASIRFRDIKNFHVDLCRPFAAHCIGYPVVTLGFGFKSYVSYRMRLMKQKDVQKDNDFYSKLLQQALPLEQKMQQRQEGEAEEAIGAAEIEAVPVIENGGHSVKKSKPVALSELDIKDKGKDCNAEEGEKQNSIGLNNNNVHTLDCQLLDIDYIKTYIKGKGINTNLTGENVNTNVKPKEDVRTTGKICKTSSGVEGNLSGSPPRSNSSCNGSVPSGSTTSKSERKNKGVGKSQKDPSENCIPYNQLGKPDPVVRLEQDMKRLKADLHTNRQLELELRAQLSSLRSQEGLLRSELGHLQQENELLQNKLHSAVQAKQKDKQAVSLLERRLKGEQEARAVAEKQLADERKRKKNEEANAAKAAATRVESTDSMRAQMRDLETELKKLEDDLKLKDKQIRDLMGKCQDLQKYKENEKDTEVLMSALSAMQEKTHHLENSLSAETRIKLDLFSALGDAKRQLEIVQGQIHQREQEITELKQKIAEVMAVMPSLSYSSDGRNRSPVSPHYSSKFMDNSSASLDPNASLYHPLNN